MTTSNPSRGRLGLRFSDVRLKGPWFPRFLVSCFLGFPIGFTGFAWGQSDSPDPLATLEVIRDKAQTPSFVVGYFEAGKETEIFSVGFKKNGSQKRVSNDDLYHLGSCTKAMTATLIGKLVDRGELRWDSTLVELFPTEVSTDSAWASVTVDQLLRHRSGCPANMDYHSLSLEDVDGTPMRRQILTWLLSQKRKVPSSFEYSNVGYILLGYIVESKYRKSWEEVIRKELFEPLGMTSAGFGSPCLLEPKDGYSSSVPGKDNPLATRDAKEPVREFVWGHRTLFGIHIPSDIDNAPFLGPAGTVHATPEDWSKFLRLHAMALEPGKADTILREETLRHLHEPDEESMYAGGWIIFEREWAKGPVLFHNGSNTVWFCNVFLVPEQKRGIFAMTNAADTKSQRAIDQALQWMIKRHPRVD